MAHVQDFKLQASAAVAKYPVVSEFLEPEGTPDLLAGLKDLEAWLGTRKGKGTWSRGRSEREGKR
jgi:hypothetical protein